MKFTALIPACAVVVVTIFSEKAFAATLKRQSGPVDPKTDPDCTYYDTAYTETDDCTYFEEWWGIPHKDFVAWNPSVLDDCSGIKVGNSYCVEVTRKPTTSTNVPTPTGTPKPSPTQEGLIESCTAFYKAVKGDTCDKVVTKYGGTFTATQFKEWNPAVGEDCSGIWAETYYCVGIPGTPTSPPTTSPTGAPKPSPTQEGLIESCTTFYKAVKGDTCDKIVSKYGTFTGADFFKWNPAVGSDCSGIWAETYYCVGIPGTPTLPPTTTPTGTPKPSPTQEGLIDTCTTFYKAVKDDDCTGIVRKFGTFTLAQFVKWNPAVGNDCTGLWANTYYCVGIPGTPTTRLPTTTTTTPKTTTTAGNGISTPTPTQAGMVSNCDSFHLVVKGDNCDTIAAKNGISVSQLASWNDVGGAACTGLWLNAYVCVSTIGHTPSTTKTTTKATTTTPAACQTAHPTPTQPGSVCRCRQWYLPGSTEFCADIQKKFGITAAQFNQWNPEVGSDCKGLWKGYHVCVKV